jgi:peroxiredoxin
MRLFAVLFLSALSVFAQGGALSNRRAPGFSLPDSKLRQHDLADYRGKIVLVDLMRTDCPHCQTLSTTLEKVRARYGEKLQILSIVTPPDTPATVLQYSNTFGVKTPVLFDCGQVAASYMKATPQNPKVDLPHLFLIDAQGMIRNDWGVTAANAAIMSGDGLYAEIDRVLGQSAVKK